MKKWHYEAFRDAIQDEASGCVYQFPELNEALFANGISLPSTTKMQAVREICRLILAERKVTDRWCETVESHGLQSQLLDREAYANRHDIAECYREFCNDFGACCSWLPLSYWDDADHIGPVDYIAARITK